MSYIDKITNKDTGESRVISPAAEAVRVSNENYEGENLDDVLDEVAHAIEDAGSGDGTVTGVKIGSTTYEPTDGVVDLSSPMSNKVDKETGKGLSTNDYTTAEKTKLGSLPTNPVQTISVNGGTPATPVNGNVNISVSGGDVSKVKIGSTEYTPNSSGVVDISAGVAAEQPTIDPTTGNWVIGGTVSQYPSKGQDGNSGVASGDEVESVNNLNGGKTDTQSKVYVLGANQGKRLRDQIEFVYQRVQTLYGLLGNIAFWDGKTPIATLLPDLDWGNPKHNVALSLTLTNAVVKHNGVAKSNGDTIQVEEGGTLTLTVEAASGYALTSVTSSTTGADVTDLGNGTYSVAITMGGSDMTLSITATGAAPAVITIDNQVGAGIVIKQGTTELEDGDTVNVAYGGTLTLTVEAASGYDIDSLTASLGGSSISPTESSGVYTITAQNITSDATLSIGGSTTKQPTYVFLPRKMTQFNNNVITSLAARATYLRQDEVGDTRTQWGSHDSNDATAEMALYSAIPIPVGATTLKVMMETADTNIQWGVQFSGNTLSLIGAYGWKDSQNTAHSLALSGYSGATQIAFNFQKKSGEFNVSDTLESLGIDFSFSFE